MYRSLYQLDEDERTLLDHIFETLGTLLFDSHMDLSAIGTITQAEFKISDSVETQLNVVITGQLNFQCKSGDHQIIGSFELHHGVSTAHRFTIPWNFERPLDGDDKLRLNIAANGSEVLTVRIESDGSIGDLTPRQDFINPCGLSEAVRRSADETFRKAWKLAQGWHGSEEKAAARRLESKLKDVYLERALQGI